MSPIETIMRTAPVIPVLVIDDAAHARPIAQALVAGGLTVLEVTLRTPAALDVIREMSAVKGAIVGAGTVLNEADLRASIDAGAQFIVSPGLTEPLGRAAIASGIPFLPGIANAGDIMRGLDMGGTLFLDEIGHLPLALQGKLLRVLEERTLRRVGGTKTIPFDVRVIAATHVQLKEAVSRGEFREDLWYRLNVMPIELPPLRDRADDVVGLAQAFVTKFAHEYGLSPAPQISAAAQRALTERAWPGNVRELRNVIERALLLSDGVRLEVADLAGEGATVAAGSSGGELPWPASLSMLARGAASAMMQRCGGNKSEAARRLGISRPRLQRLLDAQSTGAPDDDLSEDF